MEKTIKVLIANENEEETNEISDKLEKIEDKQYKLELVKTNNGDEAIKFLKDDFYDVLITDLILPGSDGFEVIEKAKNISSLTKIIVISNLTNDFFIKKSNLLGVEYYMLKPLSLDVLEKRVVDLIEVDKTKMKENINFNEIEEKITNIFITVGIPPHIKGYQFLREAIKIAMQSPDIINSITKRLYPTIAFRYNTTASKVERAIRHAIEVAWNRGRIGNINDIFGLTIYENNEKPTNGEFIALVADKMLLETAQEEEEYSK